MALIKHNNIKRIEKDRNMVHTPVDATYTIFKDNSGEVYFQIDTYGSSQRQILGKISQSIQFDKSTAQELVKLLKEEFKI
ncbi:methionyl-tRNA formyltransferase [Bacillus sp. MRMR6]|uniref:methionyl-tRNA formyltransferase n=1 Tax=Bacillus sp. MRMR6 TaxID=1928617 RepID=UPI000951CAA6|nr:methionyl-tRNA formyltransferase [Bacillus sp. MRMR6]OLS33756.1 methionyl-tRNA formyltransferase [Bacillus sp. MRMR6]